MKRICSRARVRWNALSIEDRIVLDIAYRDALARPYLISDMRISKRKLKSGIVVTINEIRFGYSNFVIIEYLSRYYILDLWLESGIYLEFD